MASINLLKYTVTSPADDTPLQKLQEDGYDVSDILGVVGKTEGLETLIPCKSMLTMGRQWLRE
jgi:hypothetical protein